MSGRLETRTVFVDTSVFVSQNLAFGGDRFSRLRELCAADKLRLVLPDVTVREIKARIQEGVNAAARVLREAKRKANIFKPLQQPGLADVFDRNIDKRAYREALEQRLHDFLNEAKCEVIDVADIPAGPVLDRYFGRKPPFGEGKKKHEFPDAFALAALRDRHERTGEKIYVVSEDKDMKEACEEPGPFILVAGLSELFELVLKEEDMILKEEGTKEGLTIEEAHARFAEIQLEIQETAEGMLKNLSMLLLDQDGEAEEVEVFDVQLGQESVVSLSEENVDYALSAWFHFKADVRYPDPDTAIYDKEDGVYFYYDYVEKTVERVLEVPIEVSARFHPDDPRAIEVTRVVLNEGDFLWIKAQEDA